MAQNPGFINRDGKIIGHLSACLTKTYTMLRHGIRPIWIFDGKPPTIKQGKLKERKNIERRSFRLTRELINETKYLLYLLGIPYVDSPGEADAQCCAFNMTHLVDGVVSDDWDIALFGGRKILKHFSSQC